MSHQNSFRVVPSLTSNLLRSYPVFTRLTVGATQVRPLYPSLIGVQLTVPPDVSTSNSRRTWGVSDKRKLPSTLVVWEFWRCPHYRCGGPENVSSLLDIHTVSTSHGVYDTHKLYTMDNEKRSTLPVSPFRGMWRQSVGLVGNQTSQVNKH